MTFYALRQSFIYKTKAEVLFYVALTRHIGHQHISHMTYTCSGARHIGHKHVSHMTYTCSGARHIGH